jgi:predicted GNAT superfamily acetyltransferase
MALTFKDIQTYPELQVVETLQKEVWGFDDLDVVPAAMLRASQKNSAVLIGAYDDDVMVGFVYGFVGIEHEEVTMHSHMLAVKSEYRSQNLGYRLKLAQRERTLELGIRLMTWTFDPLQALNAYFNFAKLGVYSDRYEVNFYGEQSSSPLHQGVGTDRLWVTWPIASERVKNRIAGQAGKTSGLRFRLDELRQLPVITASSPDTGFSAEQADDLIISSESFLLEIPGDINDLKARDIEAARRWRETIQHAFLRALHEGYIAEEFVRLELEGRRQYCYLLSRTNPAVWS